MDGYLRTSFDKMRTKTEEMKAKKGEERMTDRSRINVCNSLAFHPFVYLESFSKLMTVKKYVLRKYDRALYDVKCRVCERNKVLIDMF